MPQFPNKRKIALLSRDRPFLLKAALILGAISLPAAFFISYFTTTPSQKGKAPSFDSFSQFSSAIRNPELLHSHHLAEDLRFLNRKAIQAHPQKGDSKVEFFLPKAIASSERLNDNEKNLLTLFYQGLRIEKKRNQAIKSLTKLPENTRYRSEFLGDIHHVSDRNEEALAYYLEEGKAFSNARYSQRSAILELWWSQDFDQLKALLKTPGFRNALRASELMPILADARDFPALLGVSFRQTLDQLRFPGLIPPLFTAAIWALILLSFCRITKRILILSLLAFLLGVLSTSLTLFAVMLQERIQGFDLPSSVTPLAQIIYWVAGVGLREETVKLLFFAPLAIWILPKRDNLEALILAGMVGLGFACEENISYFGNETGGVVIWSRFLTANALHFSLTGVVGFFFFRMLVRKGRGTEDFLINFLIVVLAHGVYDALIGMPSLAEYSPLGIIALALIAYRYFDQLREHLDTQSLHRRVSPLGVFVIGSAILLYSIMIFSAGQNPFSQALGFFAISLGSMLPLAFAFISRFRDV